MLFPLLHIKKMAAIIQNSRIISECDMHLDKLSSMTADKQRIAYLRKLNEDQLILLPLDVILPTLEHADTIKKIINLDRTVYAIDIPAIVRTLNLITSSPKLCNGIVTSLFTSEMLLYLDQIVITFKANNMDSDDIDIFLKKMLTYTDRCVCDLIPEIRVAATKTFAILKEPISEETPRSTANGFRLLHFWANGIQVFDEETIEDMLQHTEEYYNGNCDWLRRKCENILAAHHNLAANPIPAKRAKTSDDTCTICSSALIDAAFNPCGHCVCCHGCAWAIFQAPIPICPICKKMVKDVLKLSFIINKEEEENKREIHHT